MILTPNVVDLSHYDNVTDWDLVKSYGIRGVINKATEGNGMVDKTFAIRRIPSTSRGILYGAYHFLRPGNVNAQVEHFLGVTKPHENLLLALDHEDPRVPLSSARQFMEIVYAQTGQMPALYSGFLIKQQLGNKVDPFWVKVRLWLSHYSANPVWPKCWEKPWLIQFTGDGLGPLPHNVPGITIDGAGIDINSYAGNADKLAAEWSNHAVH